MYLLARFNFKQHFSLICTYEEEIAMDNPKCFINSSLACSEKVEGFASNNWIKEAVWTGNNFFNFSFPFRVDVIPGKMVPLLFKSL